MTAAGMKALTPALRTWRGVELHAQLGQLCIR
jgi:hypothetical protein